MKRRIRMVLALVLTLPPFAIAAAQDARVVKGVIEDPTGGRIAKATVRLVHSATSQAFERVSDDAGQFEFAGLPSGEYVLKVQAEGFEEDTRPVQVGAEPIPLLRIRLKIAPQAEEVTVEGAAELLSSEQNRGTVDVKDRLLSQLPTKDGEPLSVASLFLSPASVGSEGASILVDGVESSNLDIPPLTIKRIYINKNPYSAEFSTPGQGRVEVVTQKASEDHYHRRLRFSLRNSVLDARDPFALVRPPRHRELLEGQFGGPSLGGKAGFLLGAIYLRNSESSVVRAQTPAGTVVENVDSPERKIRLLGRTDFRLNTAHSLTARYKFKRVSRSNQGVGGFDLPERATSFSDTEHQIRVSENAAPSSNFANELRFSFQNESDATRSATDQVAILVVGAFNAGGAQVAQQQREISIDVQDVATLIRGSHSLRFGAGIRSRFFRVSDASNFGGTFTFAGLGDFVANRPFLFTVNRGNPRVSLTQHEFSYFLQDELRLSPNVSLSLGLRHSLQSNLDDNNNLAPRAGLAYAPGGGRTVIRFGGGAFYERQPAVMEKQRLLLDGSRIRQAVVSNPSFPQVPDGVIALSLTTPSVVRIAPDMRAPYRVQASVSLERTFSRNNSVAAEYTTIRGLKLYRLRNVNAPLSGTRARPDPRLTNVNQFESSGRSRTHALTVTYRADLTGRFDLLAQYTLSRTLDDTSGLFSLPANNYDLTGEWGRADFDRRHRFNLVGTFRFPLGLKLGAIASFSSGIPFNITTGSDDNGDTVANDRPAAVGRNTGIGPGFANVDVRLSRKFRFAENSNSSKYIQLYVDAFNIFNHVNFTNFVGALSSPFFGRANSASPPRTLQISVDFKF